ncbi:MAG: hypothetical protein HS108_04480 [Planctomycetes bacterium]|jgi:hypothetical protein|nr:hypothetical protein [Planctomycetota bacterium]MCL4731235.1 hypothetical protein [Planctomycetota bacterium]
MEGVAEVKQAVRQGKAVVACAYTSHVPDSIRAQLAPGLRGPYVLRIEAGKVVRAQDGAAEEAILGLLPVAD